MYMSYTLQLHVNVNFEAILTVILYITSTQMSQPLLHATSSPLPACTHHSVSNPIHTLPTKISCSWSSNLSPVDIQSFTQPVGPALQVLQTELEVFQLCFTVENCSFIAE